MLFSEYVLLFDIAEELDIDTDALGISIQVLDVTIELEFELIIHDIGRPEVKHRQNGDPGNQEEPAEYEIELASNIEEVLEAVVSDRVSTLFQVFIQQWVEIHCGRLADEAFENFANSGG